MLLYTEHAVTSIPQELSPCADTRTVTKAVSVRTDRQTDTPTQTVCPLFLTRVNAV